MQRTKKTLLALIGLFIIALCGMFATIQTNTASAAASITPTYVTNGKTQVGDVTYWYDLEDFKVCMHGLSTDGTTGTLVDNKLTAWDSYVITVKPINVVLHLNFKLYRNDVLIESKDLTGNGELELFSGVLDDGDYKLVYTANVGNVLVYQKYVYTYNFRVDNTVPSQRLRVNGANIKSGRYVNKQIDYVAQDVNLDYIKYMMPNTTTYSVKYTEMYTVTATESNNGWWSFCAVDCTDNETKEMSVYLDTILPVGTVKNKDGQIVENGGYTNSAISYSATDNGSGVSYCQVKMPNTDKWIDYTAGTEITPAYGWTVFRAVDETSNVSKEYSVYYENEKPIGKVYGGDTLLGSGSYTNADCVKYEATDNYSGIKKFYVKMPNNENYTAYAKGLQLATEGTYYFYAEDFSGCVSDISSITLDKTLPTGKIYSGGTPVPSGSFVNTDYIYFSASDNNGIAKTYVKMPNDNMYYEYSQETRLEDEGEYLFFAEDVSKNISEVYVVTIDRKVPTAQLFVDGNPIESGSYTNGTHIYFECTGQGYVKRPNSSGFVEYMSGTEFYMTGKYVFYGVSVSGTCTDYYTVIIDRTIKTVSINNVIDGKTDGDVVITWTDGDKELYAPIKTVTINGKEYVKESVVYTINTGVYDVKVVDSGNNEWETRFTSTKKNIVTDTLQKEYYESQDKNGDFYSFATYDSTLTFAKNRENSLVKKGEWKSSHWDIGIAMDAVDSVNAKNGFYYIYKKEENPKELVAYFTLERLNAVITKYANESIKSYYYWEKAPKKPFDGENLYSYSDTKTILSNSVRLGNNIGALLDGKKIMENTIGVEGKHVLTVFDEWENACEYTLIIVKKPPDIKYASVEENVNTVIFNRTYYFKNKVTVFITDSYDEMAMFTVFDSNGKTLTCLSIGKTYEIASTGTYSVVAVNHAGKSQKFNLIVSLNEPSIKITEMAKEKQLSIIINKSLDKESHIQTLEIYKSTNDGKDWSIVKKDDYGTQIGVESLSYKFRTSGLYMVKITDEFRTGIDAVTNQFNYIQPSPIGVLNGTENGGYTNGAVAFTWTDEAVVTVEKDGQIMTYSSGMELTADGYYLLAIENYDGYKATYSFTIDTVLPEITIEGAKQGDSVNNDVKVFFSEENTIAELYKNGKLLGQYFSGNPVYTDGEYLIVVRDMADNKVEVEFVIDKTVDYAINVNDKGLSNSVIITANEHVTVILLKNEEQISYVLGSTITEPANYDLTLFDNLGNVETMSFEIVKPLVKSFTHNFDDVQGLAGVTVNGEDKRLNYGTLELYEDGQYEVGVMVSGNKYLFTVTVDNTAPTIMLLGVGNGGETKGAVKIAEVSEQAEISLIKDGVQVEYTLGDEITEYGEYKAVVTDLCGNVAEYTFIIQKSLSGVTIALIVIGSIVVIGAIVLVVLKKKRNI